MPSPHSSEGLALSHFEVIIHICVILNFLYAITDEFSEKVFPIIARNFTRGFNERFGACSVMMADFRTRYPNEKSMVRTYVSLQNDVERFTDNADRDKELTAQFRSIYMIAGFYSFLLLFHAALFEHYYIYPEVMNCIIFWTNIFILVFYTVVICFTFQKRKDGKPRRRVMTWKVIIFFFLIVLFQLLWYSFKWPHVHKKFSDECFHNPNYQTMLTIMVIMLPIMLHIVRALIKFITKGITINKKLNMVNAHLKLMNDDLDQNDEEDNNDGNEPDSTVSKMPDSMDPFMGKIDEIIAKHIERSKNAKRK